jgi:hypothetical protein
MNAVLHRRTQEVPIVERQKITDRACRWLFKISAFMPEGRALFSLKKLC